MGTKKITAFVYPDSAANGFIDNNPYTNNLKLALTKHGINCIDGHTNSYGVLDFFLYFFKVDILFLNWIEDIKYRKFGDIQYLLLRLILPLLALRKVKVVWILHNKVSHSDKHLSSMIQIRKKLERLSSLILVHSNSALQDFSYLKNKIKFFNHPFEEYIYPKKEFKKPDVDILIWGNLHKYKGVELFLSFWEKSILANSLKLRIVGKCQSDEYFNQLKKFNSNNIEIVNSFLTPEELKQNISNSNCVLFTHSDGSVYSSGALIKTIEEGASFIIGPSLGNFLDLRKNGLVQTYDSFDEILEIYTSHKHIHSGVQTSIQKKFIKENSWDAFVDFIITELNKISI